MIVYRVEVLFQGWAPMVQTRYFNGHKEAERFACESIGLGACMAAIEIGDTEKSDPVSPISWSARPAESP